MPQIIGKGISRDRFKELSRITAPKLAIIADSPVEYFTYELVESEFFINGEEFFMYPLIEIKLFDRGDEVNGAIAKLLTEELNNLGYTQMEIFFTKIEYKDYYENGEHY